MNDNTILRHLFCFYYMTRLLHCEVINILNIFVTFNVKFIFVIYYRVVILIIPFSVSFGYITISGPCFLFSEVITNLVIS